jgi:hypothetical protein
LPEVTVHDPKLQHANLGHHSVTTKEGKKIWKPFRNPETHFDNLLRKVVSGGTPNMYPIQWDSSLIVGRNIDPRPGLRALSIDPIVS